MTHQEIQELLPWYVNATLTDVERSAVEAHLAGCTTCGHVADQLRAVRAAARVLAEESPAPSPALLGQALERIVRRRRRPGEVLASWGAGWRALPTVARVTLAAQLLVIVGLGGYMAIQIAGEAEFRTAADGREARAQIVVAFQAAAPDTAVRRALLGVQGAIVSGPSALGLYTVELPIPRDRVEEIDRVLQRLRQDHAVVRLAERLP